MGNVNEGKGLFAPAVVIAQNVIGKKRFNQIRGKAIALHSQEKELNRPPTDAKVFLETGKKKKKAQQKKTLKMIDTLEQLTQEQTKM